MLLCQVRIDRSVTICGSTGRHLCIVKHSTGLREIHHLEGPVFVYGREALNKADKTKTKTKTKRIVGQVALRPEMRNQIFFILIAN